MRKGTQEDPTGKELKSEPRSPSQAVNPKELEEMTNPDSRIRAENRGLCENKKLEGKVESA